VEVNARACPERADRIELFGHLKGSFTRRHEDKNGKFHESRWRNAFSATNIGDMSLRNAIQKFLRVSKSRASRRRVNEICAWDVRVIAADEQEYRAGKSLAALFAGGGIFSNGQRPFFRARPYAIARKTFPLAQIFLSEFSSAYGKKTRELSDSAMEIILLRIPGRGCAGTADLLSRRVVCPQAAPARVDHLPPNFPPAAWMRVRSIVSTRTNARSAYERGNSSFRQSFRTPLEMTQLPKRSGLERSHLYRKMKSL